MAFRNQIRAASSVAAIIVGLGIAVPAQAGMNMEGLLEKLRDKGVLTEEEYQEMRQEAREARRAEALEKAQAADDKQKAKVKVTGDEFKDRFTFSTPDGNAQIRLTGRVHADYRNFNHDYSLNAAAQNDRDTASIADGFELRRARFGFQGFVYRDVAFELQANAVGGAPVVDQAFVNLGWYKPAQLRFGRFKQPFNLEEQTSSNDIDFAERSYVNQLAPAKKLGAMLHGIPFGKEGLYYGVSVFQEGFNEETESDGAGKRYAGRLTADFGKLFKITDTVIHAGISGVGGSYECRPAQTSQSDTTSSTTRCTVVGVRTLNRGLNNPYRAQIPGTALGASGAGAGIPSESSVNVSQDMVGLEGAVAYGPYKLQGEWVTASYDANNPLGNQRLDGNVSAYYVQALWNITGEKWADGYKEGRFGSMKVRNTFAPGGGWGAFQVGFRWSRFDAGDINVSGTNSRIQSGRFCDSSTSNSACAKQNAVLDSWGVGLNWYPNPMTRVMLEFTRTQYGGLTVPLDVNNNAGQNTGTKGIMHEDVISIRTQLNF